MRQIVFLGVDDTERRDTEQALHDSERFATVGEMAAHNGARAQPAAAGDRPRLAAARDELSEAGDRGVAVDPQYMATKLDRIGQQVEPPAASSAT